MIWLESQLVHRLDSISWIAYFCSNIQWCCSRAIRYFGQIFSNLTEVRFGNTLWLAARAPAAIRECGADMKNPKRAAGLHKRSVRSHSGMKPLRYRCPRCKWEFALRRKKSCPGCGILLLIPSDKASDPELTLLCSFWMLDPVRRKWAYIHDWEAHKRDSMQKLEEHLETVGRSQNSTKLIC